MYNGLANLLVVVHTLVVACVLIGSIAAIVGILRRYRKPEIAWYTLLLAVIASDRLVGECLLTGWEKALRNLDQPASAYRNSFLGHYFSWLPPFVLERIGPALTIGGLLAYPFWHWLDWRSRRARRVAGIKASEEYPAV